MITTLYYDVNLKIGEFLSDREKIRFSAITRDMGQLRRKFMYYEKIHVREIRHLLYFNNFEYVEISNAENIRPRFAKYIYYEARSSNIPSFVTHLKFHDYFNQPINYRIPTSVTHLIFGDSFNQPIFDYIPASVTHLTFSMSFVGKQTDKIPNSVTHLFMYPYNDMITEEVKSRVILTQLFYIH